MIYDPKLENCRDITSEDIKRIEIKCSSLTEITLKLLSTCNFRCPYCIVSNTNDKRSIKPNYKNICTTFENLKSLVEYHKQIIGETKYIIQLHGGEPTILNLPLLIKCANLHNVIYRFMTNLSKPVSYFKEMKEICDELDCSMDIVASWHSIEYTKKCGNVDDFINKISEIEKFCRIKITTVINKETIKSTTEMCEKALQKLKYPKIMIKIDKTLGENVDNDIKEAFLNLKEKMCSNSKRYNNGSVTTVTFKDDRVSSGGLNDLIFSIKDMRKVSFKGHYCSTLSDFKRLVIRVEDGSIYSCFNATKPSGNILTKDFDFLSKSNTKTKCENDHCSLSLRKGEIYA